jgi:hypothetical protein
MEGVTNRPDAHAMNEARTTVIVSGQAITVEGLTLHDPALAAFVAEAAEPDRPALAERALRIGLLAICNANATVNVDVVRAEFGRLVTDLAATQTEAANALETTLRANFADGDGRLPRQLEAYLGDSGKLNRLVGDLFDEGRRDSALGRLRELLGRYFDGDGSQLATLLDPTRRGSPLYQFRTEMSDEFRRLNERLEALEAGAKARAEERARGTAKGADFEAALEERLGALARGMGDLVERTGAEGGDAMTSKKGDLVITVDPTRTRGTSLRIVVEAKDRSMPLGRMTKELAEARVNRSAAIALAVFTPHTAPAAVSPLAMVGSDVFATYDPDADDAVALEAAYRAARILALVTLRDAAVRLDAEAVARSLEDLSRQVDVVRALKTKLTHIGSTAREVSDALDLLRAGVLRSVKELELQLAVVEDGAADALTA